MAWLFWLVVIAAVVLGVVLLAHQQPGVPRQSNLQSSATRTLFNLQIGDIVQYQGTDWVVEGQLVYDEDGYTWLEYLLQDGDRICWLVVDEDDRVEVSLLRPTTELEVGPEPPPQLTFAGETYRCVESGTARMVRIGSTRRRQAEQCLYFDYTGPADKVLSIEDWDGDREITVGQRISPRSLTLLPGEGKSVYGV